MSICDLPIFPSQGRISPALRLAVIADKPVEHMDIRCHDTVVRRHGSSISELAVYANEILSTVSLQNPTVSDINVAIKLFDSGLKFEHSCLMYKPYRHSYLDYMDPFATAKRIVVNNLLNGSIQTCLGKIHISPISNPVIDLTYFLNTLGFKSNSTDLQTQISEIIEFIQGETRNIVIFAIAYRRANNMGSNIPDIEHF